MVVAEGKEGVPYWANLPIMASSIQQPSKESFRVGHGQVFGILTNYAL